tara:strand:- start:359 stop:517 length:159 start_codon:yes stop_codon:yes gene_type:complete
MSRIKYKNVKVSTKSIPFAVLNEIFPTQTVQIKLKKYNEIVLRCTRSIQAKC